MRRTKIVCTLGPVSNSEQKIKQLIKYGMNVARLNFSHGDHEYHQVNIDNLKKIRKELNVSLAILLDTRGPEIRIKHFKNDSCILVDGETFTLTSRDILGDKTIVSVTFDKLPTTVSIGTKIVIDDGNIVLKVLSTNDTDVECLIVHGGKISNRKSVNIPKVRIDIPYMSEHDKGDLLFGIKNDVDFIAASFVRNADDVIELRKFLDYNGGHTIKIISKIENLEGVDNFDKILLNSDGIMVARGDMGVEVDYEKLPGLQKRFIKKCYQAGKMVITATQMLESMMEHPSPTRAEITDVANAVFDGTSAVMLSGETAAGKFPVQAVKVMAKIAEQAEKDAFLMNAYKSFKMETNLEDTTNAICDAACTTARDIAAAAIIALTKSGQTARGSSKFRPQVPIVAATPNEKTYHQLAMSWGVYPVLAITQDNFDNLFQHAIDCANQINLVKNNDKVVIIAGLPLDIPGNTNILKVATVENLNK